MKNERNSGSETAIMRVGVDRDRGVVVAYAIKHHLEEGLVCCGVPGSEEEVERMDIRAKDGRAIGQFVG